MTVRRTGRWNLIAAQTLASSLCVALIAVAGVMVDNPGEVAPSETLRALGVAFGAAFVIPALLIAIGGPIRVAALAFPIILFAFFKFSCFVGATEIVGLPPSVGFWTAMAFFVLIAAACIDSARRRDPQKFTSFIFVVSGCIAAASLLPVALSFFAAKPAGRLLAQSIIDTAPHPAFSARNAPDIIYIVPDRYGSDEVIRREFNYDNRPFRSELENRGFHVAENARSNYAKTVLSLASSLNMTDLSPLADAVGPESVDRRPLYHMIRENAVQETLRKSGYGYVHLGNWWGPSRRSPYADAHFYGVNTIWSMTNEFETALLRLTPISWFATDGAAAERVECDRLKNQLTYLEGVRARSGDRPVFAFAHLTIPHDPITMNENGDCIEHVYYPGNDVSFQDYQAAYSGYVAYLNKRLLKIFDANKSVDNGRGLIFVVQADEGPYPKRLQEDSAMIMQDFNNDEVREKFGIINAIYWDAEKYGPPYLTKTPINNWRIILSKISGDGIPLVEDERSRLMHSDKQVYDNKDVTGILTGAGPQLQARAD